jgi:hypothetical protein
MSNTFEILNPVRELKLAAVTVTVRELPWRDQKLAMDKIISQINTLLKPGPGMSLPAGGITLNVETLIAGIKDSAELAQWLMVKATDLRPEQIEELSVTEFFGVLEHAVDLNVVGYMAGAKKAFGRIGNFVGNGAAGPTAPATIPSAQP